MLVITAIKELLTFTDKTKVDKKKEEFQALLRQIEEELKSVIEFEKYVEKINEDLEKKRKEFEQYKRLDENILYSKLDEIENRSFNLTLNNIKLRKENKLMSNDLDLYDAVIDIYEKQTNVKFDQIVKLIELESIKENLPKAKKLTEQEKLNKKQESIRETHNIEKEDDLEVVEIAGL
jgi:hypothetical protein